MNRFRFIVEEQCPVCRQIKNADAKFCRLKEWMDLVWRADNSHWIRKQIILGAVRAGVLR